jgi:hypothetical protein
MISIELTTSTTAIKYDASLWKFFTKGTFGSSFENVNTDLPPN